MLNLLAAMSRCLSRLPHLHPDSWCYLQIWMTHLHLFPNSLLLQSSHFSHPLNVLSVLHCASISAHTLLLFTSPTRSEAASPLLPLHPHIHQIQPHPRLSTSPTSRICAPTRIFHSPNQCALMMPISLFPIWHVLKSMSYSLQHSWITHLCPPASQLQEKHSLHST